MNMNMNRGGYVDERGIKWDTNITDYEGWIGKRSKWLGEWRNRYFLLIGTKLFYAKDERSTPHGMIDLIDCISATAINNNDNNNEIEIKLQTKTFSIITKSRKEQIEWLDVINRCINNYLHYSS